MNAVQDEPLLSDEAEADEDPGDVHEYSEFQSETCADSSRSTLATLFLFVLFCGIANSVLFNTLPQYILNRVGNSSSDLNGSRCVVSPSDPSFQANERAQEESSWILAKVQIAGGVPAIFLAIFYGSFSDRYGRVPTLVLPWAGCLVFFVLTCVHVALDTGFWLLILGSALFGLTGNFVTYLAGIFALLADLVPPQQRSLAIVALEAALGLSLVLGNLGAGYFIRAVGFKVPIYASSGLLVFSGVFFCFLREPEKAARVAPSLRMFVAHVRSTLESDIQRSIVSAFFLAAFFLQVLCYIGSMNINVLYLLNAPFCFSAVHLGLFYAVQGISLQVGSAGIAWLLRKKIGDPALAIIGLLSYTVANFFRGFAGSFAAPTDIAMLVVSVALGIASTLTAAMIRAILSKLFDSEHQGIIFALTASAETMATILGGILLNAVYASTLSFYHGFVYYFMAALNVASILLIVLGSRWHRRAQAGSTRFARL